MPQTLLLKTSPPCTVSRACAVWFRKRRRVENYHFLEFSKRRPPHLASTVSHDAVGARDVERVRVRHAAVHRLLHDGEPARERLVHLHGVVYGVVRGALGNRRKRYTTPYRTYTLYT